MAMLGGRVYVERMETSMWEALMMLRLIASVAPDFSVGRRASQPIFAAQTIEGAIRLTFEGYRLSLPIPTLNTPNHGQKIA
ncbi:hypothetical protein [Mesorhizobium sp.]|uniref:hypothetical protein n=1 Tax=Mesorhizobium sp. TaxID=1871066 RepID=UPI0025B9851F|nr:hypothetical protein [Mesorhizobium sp.]